MVCHAVMLIDSAPDEQRCTKMVLNDAVRSIIATRATIVTATAFQASSVTHVICVPQQKQLQGTLAEAAAGVNS